MVFMCGGGRTRTRTVRLLMRKRWFQNFVDGMKGLVCEKRKEKTRLDWDERNRESISGKLVVCLFVRQNFEGKTSCSIGKVVELR